MLRVIVIRQPESQDDEVVICPSKGQEFRSSKITNAPIEPPAAPVAAKAATVPTNNDIIGYSNGISSASNETHKVCYCNCSV